MGMSPRSTKTNPADNRSGNQRAVIGAPFFWGGGGEASDQG